MVFQDPDQLTKSKTMYDVGTGEIIWRNFLAGMSRALGSMVIYFAVVLFLGNIFLNYIWPSLEPSFETLGETTELLQQMNMMGQPSLVR